jgi:5'-nucleotidase
LLKIDAIAFSMDPDGSKDWRGAGVFAQRLAKQVLKKELPKGVCLNVNFPANGGKPYKPGVPAKLGRRIYGTDVTRRSDPRGLEYYWLAGRQVSGVNEPGTDVGVVSKGRASVTPLKIDSTDPSMLQALTAWPL